MQSIRLVSRFAPNALVFLLSGVCLLSAGLFVLPLENNLNEYLKLQSRLDDFQAHIKGFQPDILNELEGIEAKTQSLLADDQEWVAFDRLLIDVRRLIMESAARGRATSLDLQLQLGPLQKLLQLRINRLQAEQNNASVLLGSCLIFLGFFLLFVSFLSARTSAPADDNNLSDLPLVPVAIPFPVIRTTGSGSLLNANEMALALAERIGLGEGVQGLLPENLQHRLADLQHADDEPDYLVVWEYPVSQRMLECTFHFSPLAESRDFYLRDVTEWRNSEQAYIHHSLHDPLTGLRNRQLFKQSIDDLIAGAGRSALLLLGMNRFRNLQGSIGHEMADELIRLVSERLQQELHKYCVEFRVNLPIYRFERDMFAVLFQGYRRRRQINRLSSKLLSVMNRPYHLRNREFHVNFCLGISLCPEDGNDGVTVIKNAESALHQAKQGSELGFEFYSSEMNAMASADLEKENFLRYAIERDELQLFYQPQIDVATGAVCGMEALLRWKHPVHGVMSPDAFIPLAEETGLITSLTEWTLREACLQLVRWRNAGFANIPVAVNISAEQFLHMDLPGLTTEVLSETGLPPESLELEITESVALRDLERTCEVMQALKQKNILLAIDDFGTGFSSMTYLKAFPVDKVKIDREFVQNVGNDRYDSAICSAVISLANSLGLTVIAEGIDSQGQMEWLKQHGCHQVQGFYFYPPLDAAAMLELFHSHKP